MSRSPKEKSFGICTPPESIGRGCADCRGELLFERLRIAQEERTPLPRRGIRKDFVPSGLEPVENRASRVGWRGLRDLERLGHVSVDRSGIDARDMDAVRTEQCARGLGQRMERGLAAA